MSWASKLRGNGWVCQEDRSRPRMCAVAQMYSGLGLSSVSRGFEPGHEVYSPILCHPHANNRPSIAQSGSHQPQDYCRFSPAEICARRVSLLISGVSRLLCSGARYVVNFIYFLFWLCRWEVRDFFLLHGLFIVTSGYAGLSCFFFGRVHH